jgi:molybdate transport system permease protein
MMDAFPGGLWAPLWLSLKVAGMSTLISLMLGVAAARLLARRRSAVASVLDVLCTLPMVLPPTVLGYYLILAFGRGGLLGPAMQALGFQLMFSWQGAVAASTLVVFPLIYRTARAALEQVDASLEQAARTLGATECEVFFRISLPLALRGILAGALLAFARGMGEFGATMMIAGNIPGRTQTLALAIYDAFQSGNDAQAAALVLFTSLVCALILVGAERLLGRGRA